MKSTSLLLAPILFFSMSSLCAESKSEPLGIEFTGYLDVYYQYSPEAHGPTPLPGISFLEGRVFDNFSNQVIMNMAELSARRSVGDTVFRIDLAFGQMIDALAASGAMNAATGRPLSAASEPTRNITQAILTYSPSTAPGLSVTVGKFYTHMGLEVTKAKEDWQYSRSYTFNYGIPFWHQGANVGYAFVPGKLGATLYVVNAWDGRLSAETNRTPAVGANLNAVPTEGLVLNYNYLGDPNSTAGSGRREAHEVNATYAFSSRLSFAIDGVRGSIRSVGGATAKWSGLAIYAKGSLISWHALSPRYEIFDDEDGFALGTAAAARQTIHAITITNKINLYDGLEARLEWRSDRSNSSAYFKNKNGGTADHQESWTAAVLASF